MKTKTKHSPLTGCSGHIVPPPSLCKKPAAASYAIEMTRGQTWPNRGPGGELQIALNVCAVGKGRAQTEHDKDDEGAI
jgi:hypothetical protein